MKTNEPNCKIAKNLIWGPDFGMFWAPKVFSMNFTSTRCYTLLQAIIVCNFKENLVLGPILAPLS